MTTPTATMATLTMTGDDQQSTDNSSLSSMADFKQDQVPLPTTAHTSFDPQLNSDAKLEPNRAEPLSQLELMPKELLEKITATFSRAELSAFFATSRTIKSRFFGDLTGRDFAHMKVLLFPPERLQAVGHIVAQETFSLAIRSVIIRIELDRKNFRSAMDDQMPELLATLRHAPNLTMLKFHVVGNDDLDSDDGNWQFPSVSLQKLKVLSITNGTVGLEELICFIKFQRALTTFRAEELCIEDRKLGVGFPKNVGGLRVSKVIRDRTAVENIAIEEDSEWIWKTLY